MPVTELYAFNLICEILLAALYGVAINQFAINAFKAMLQKRTDKVNDNTRFK